jgi:hypothetical protein
VSNATFARSCAGRHVRGNFRSFVYEISVKNYFRYALLMAADEDNNAFAEANRLKPLLTLADQIDRAVSAFIADWVRALRTAGPILPGHREVARHRIPRGRRPSTAPLTRSGARKASEMVMLT